MVFFGASNYGQLVYSYIENKNEVLYFCDNSPEKWGKLFCGIKVISPQQLQSLQDIRIIITSQYVIQIMKQLFNMGIKEIEVAEIIKDSEQDSYRVKYKKYDYTKIKSFDIVKNKICLIRTNNSGSNTYALYKLAPKEYKDKYELKILNECERDQDYYLDLITCSMIVGTQGAINHMSDKISLELWHGFPLKCLGSMISSAIQHDEFTRKEWNSINKIASYSQLYNILMSASFGTHISQYFISGMPRNDFLFKSNGRSVLDKVLGKELHGKKIVFYMPTFRGEVLKQENNFLESYGNLFGFSYFDYEKFENYLKKNNICLIVKLHEVEEEFILKYVDKHKIDDIHILTQKSLNKIGYDLYEVLNAADLLITDYSSVYFDYLLLDRPILYTPVDLEYYRKTRGFLLEPYDFWTPGPKVFNQDDLQEEILKLLKNRSYYENERKTIKKIVHHYTDGNSTQRIFEMIDEMMSTVD